LRTSLLDVTVGCCPTIVVFRAGACLKQKEVDKRTSAGLQSGHRVDPVNECIRLAGAQVELRDSTQVP
jgi:hypothetical protein